VEGKKTDQAWVRVYQPSFRSNVADWAPDDENAWLEIPSGLQGSAETKAYNQATHAGLQTGRIETEISVAPHSKAGFTFRDNGRHKFCYSVLLDADKKQVSLQRIAEWKIQPLQSQDVPLESGTPARIGVQIDQGVLQVFFNGKPIFQAPDEGVDAGCRRIALVVERGQAVFQNFQLSEKK
jgi:allophanate hydrolase subunit 2